MPPTKNNRSSLNLFLLAALAGTFFLSSVSHARVMSARSDHTKVTVLPQFDSLKPGGSMTVGFLMEMDPGWHTYWRNPGDSGYPTVINWTLPAGFRAGGIVWPYPHRLVLDPLTSFGYEKSTLLLSQISIPPFALPGENVPFDISVNWLECRIECVPGTAAFSFVMPVVENPQEDPAFIRYFNQFKNQYPGPLGPNLIEGFENESSIMLRVAGSGIQNANFYPYERGLIDNSAKQVLSKTSDGIQLIIAKPANAKEGRLKRIAGLLVVNEDSSNQAQSYKFNTPLKAYWPQAADLLPAPSLSLGVVIVFAFLGGLILNLMPCVLPVLSIKILSLVESAAKSKRQVFTGGLSFTAGILASFWFLAFFIIVLKSAGHSVGWGFQFQSPVFLIFMSVLFFWLGLNLFGVFEVGTPLTRIENFAGNSFLLKNSFMNGVLATVVATPCTAPFMGTALGYALSQSALMTFVIFSALGLGLAFPYLLLSLFPQWLKFIPKPGPWMIWLKKFFGLLFMVTVAWLAWVLSVQRGMSAVIYLCAGLVVIGTGGWVIGRFATLSQNNTVRWQARIVAVILFLAGFFIALYGTTFDRPPQSPSKETGVLEWVDFSQEKLEQLRAQEEIVFLDFTAKWCLSCQVNERVALYNPKVVALIKEKGIVMMRADWTNYDENITRALESYGKNSIPFYVIYAPGRDPIFLPELLTPGIVIDALNET